MASHQVKSGSVVLTVKPWRHPSGRDYFRASYHCPHANKVRHITRSTLKSAKEAAFKKAQSLAKNTLDLETLSPHQIRAIRRMLDADPQLVLVEDFLAWKAKTLPSKPLDEAADEFLDLKLQHRGRSIQNYATLKKFLTRLKAAFGSRHLSDITVPELDAFIIGKSTHSGRTRQNNRASLITFYRWCRRAGHLPDEETPAEKTEKPTVGSKIPETFTPAEMRLMLQAVRPKWLPWLACGAFAGIRTDEIFPLNGGDKSPLDWSDFHWDRGIIIIRPETDKNKRRRVVPILPALRAWLHPVRQESGPLGGKLPPSKGKDPETKRLGELIGGWKKNALRDSFISYRAAQVGLGKTSMEAGNSESEAKKSYNDAKSHEEADEWFSIVPECSQNPLSATPPKGEK